MSYVTNTNIQPGNFLTDGVYTNLVPPAPTIPNGLQTGLIAILGTAKFGPVNSPQPFVDQPSAISWFGNDTVAAHSLFREALTAMPEGQQFLGSRITDGTDVAATITIPDTSTGTIGTLTAIYTGSYPNAAAGVRFDLQSGTLAAAPVFRCTIFFPGQAAQVFSNISGGSGAFTSSTFLANLAAAINGTIPNQVGSSWFSFSAGASTLSPLLTTVTQATGGADGSAFGAVPSAPAAPVVATVGTTGTTQYQYELVAFGNGDSAPSTAGSVTTGNATLNSSNYNTVTCTTVVGQKYKLLRQIGGSGGYFYLTTFTATVVSTIINDQGQFTAITYVAAPNVTFSQGAIGTDGTVGRTGLFAFRGMVAGGQVVVAALTDGTQGQNLVSFAVQENCIVHLAMPNGTTSDAAVASRATNNLSSPVLVLSMDWLNVFDVISGQNMYVSPMGKIAACIAAQPAWQYPGNQQPGGVAGIIGTSRLNTSSSMPLSVAEQGERQQAGIIWLGYQSSQPRGPSLGLPHGMMSDGVTIISDTRMLQSIAYTMQTILGSVVGTMMVGSGSNLGQPALGQARDLLDAYLQTLQNGPPAQISGYVINVAANTSTTVQQDRLILNTSVQTLSAAQFIVNALQVGRTVQIVTNANVSTVA